MKIAAKLSIIIVLINFVLMGLMIVTIQSLSRTLITEKVIESTTNLAMTNAEQVRIFFEAPMASVRTMAQIMSRYEMFERRERRENLNSIMAQVLRENETYLGIWSVWEPNALDGLDAEYVNTPGTDETGRFISYWNKPNNRISLEALVDYDVSGPGDYYQVPLHSGNESIIEPYFYLVDGKNELITSLSVPIKEDGRVVGVVGIDLDISGLQKVADSIRPYKGSIAAIFSNTGVIAGHFDSSRNGKNMMETEGTMLGDNINMMAESVRAGEPFFFTNNDSQAKTNTAIVGIPFTVGRTDTPWSLVVGVPEKEMMAPVTTMTTISTLLGLAANIIVTIVSIITANKIAKPIKNSALMLKDISQGEGDLTRQLSAGSKDEIGDMAHYFNLTLEKIRNLIVVIKKRTEDLSSIGIDLSSHMAETATAINQIAANIQGIKNQAINQSASVSQTNSTVEQITSNIDKLNDHIAQQNDSVSQSSSAIEEMLANIASVTQTLVRNGDNVRDLSKASEDGRDGLQDMAEKIQEIARESENLLEITAVMESIASQTNLLSMNAAIEAAHAGDAGKGFAVVADEIRKLSESSGEQSKTVAGTLKKMKDSIDTIISSLGSVLSKFEEIDSSVKTVHQQEEHVRNSMEEQGVGSKQILESVSELKDVAQMLTAESAEMLEGSHEISKESKNLEMITQEINNGMNEMAAGAEQINAAISMVNEIAAQNKQNIDVLMEEVVRFKVE